MSSTLTTGGTAWLTAATLLAQVSFGLFKVNRRVLRRFHIVLGVVLIPVTLVHATLSMTTASMKSDNAMGVWIATAALLLLGVQLLVGTTLIRPSGSRSLRRFHLTVGVVIVSLASVHVLLIK